MNDLMGLISENLNNENLEIAFVNRNNDTTAKKLNKSDFLVQTKVNERMKEIGLKLSELSWHERFEWVHQKKLKGNRLIKKNRIQEAEDTYMEAIMGLDWKNGTPEENKRVVTELQTPLVLNLGSCALKKKEYEKAIKFYNKGMHFNSSYYKLYMKRAYAFTLLKEYEKASEDFSLAYKLATDDTEREDVKEAYQEYKAQKEAESKPYVKYFNGNSYQEEGKVEQSMGDYYNEEDDEEREESLLCYNDDWEELERYWPLRWPIYVSQKTYGFFKHRVFGCCRRNAPTQLNRNILKSLYSKGSDYFLNFVNPDSEEWRTND